MQDWLQRERGQGDWKAEKPAAVPGLLRPKSFILLETPHC